MIAVERADQRCGGSDRRAASASGAVIRIVHPIDDAGIREAARHIARWQPHLSRPELASPSTDPRVTMALASLIARFGRGVPRRPRTAQRGPWWSWAA
jgi:hypothetical protein